MVGTHYVPDDTGALQPRARGLQTRLVHRVEDAPVDRLEPVADVGERARDDDRHRVVEEARAHLLLEITRFDAAGTERFDVHHTSKNRTSLAFFSMNSRRGSTWSPMSIENTV